MSNHSAEISWNHAKKKDGQSENGHAEQPGQESPPPNHEKGAGDQTSEAEVISRYFEVLLKSQSDNLECLSAIRATLSQANQHLKALVDWCNWDAERRGPKL